MFSVCVYLFLDRTVLQHAEMGQCAVMYTTDVPDNCVGQVTILKYFAHYMEENLMDVSKSVLPLYL